MGRPFLQMAGTLQDRRGVNGVHVGLTHSLSVELNLLISILMDPG